MLGSMGWDDEASVLLPRAREVLKKVGLENEKIDYDMLHVKRDPGAVVLLRVLPPHSVQGRSSQKSEQLVAFT